MTKGRRFTPLGFLLFWLAQLFLVGGATLFVSRIHRPWATADVAACTSIAIGGIFVVLFVLWLGEV